MTDKVCDAELIILLRKSKTRQMVLEYLVSIYPESSYPSEIARKIDLRLNEVCGALNGSPNRYKEKNSLVKLGLVKKEQTKSSYLYTATDKGCKIWKLINK
ncbi:MAG: hypothetical protein DRG59_08785 [Deltaproteobacteria bacterium]|nr:MAG: hypothetical protein DRG59_08785 [Deltaproteobacteria bacterium]